MTETPSSAPPPASSHLDLDALADVLAGEADGAPHLASCASCTSRLAELEAAESRVVEVLGTLPPPTVPADLAARLTAALAAERPLASPRATVTALPAASPRTRRTWMPAAAAAVLLMSGAGVGYALLSDTGGGDSASVTAGGAGPDLPLNASGTDYADPAAVAGALPQVLAGSAGTVLLTEDGVGAQSGSGGAADSEGGTERSAEDSAETAEAPTAAMAVDELARLRTSDGLADCLAALLPPDEPDVQPLALDYATYAGAPALAVLLPDPDPAKLSVFVVGPGCSRADDSTLHFFRIDAP